LGGRGGVGLSFWVLGFKNECLIEIRSLIYIKGALKNDRRVDLLVADVIK
jgi:hypothetical protein